MSEPILFSCLLLLTVSAFAAMFTLMTRRKRFANRLHTMATIGRIAVGIAHDLNNLLSAIMGQAELLKRDQLLLQVKTASDEIIKLCESAARMTHHVLSQVHPSRTVVSEVDIAAHIRELKTVLDAISGRATRLNIDVDPYSVVQIPPSDVDQLLVNLVLNAREAGAATIQIDLTTNHCIGSNDCWLTIVVADDGQGMSEYVLARATEEQFSDKPSGTGIGLSTVKRILDACGGSLELRNAAGGGAIARVLLPCV